MFLSTCVRALTVGALLLTSAFTLADDARPEVADKIMAYQGEQGVKVWTLRIGARTADEALVQVEGVDHDWNLRIQKMKVEKTAKDMRYSTEVNGQKFVALILQDDYGELYLPDESRKLNVGYSEWLSSQGNAQAFLTDYLNQK
ncbi:MULTISPECIES: hypothetical protein [unclassified Pseudomonas]|uniref:hypothetical protein n=1 Tax=unclassified Pseudomonas TaxID=196821 RepID=UPI0025E679A7|nr:MULTISPECIES: hypothetical protein [unclassified Pseudomonas]